MPHPTTTFEMRGEIKAGVMDSIVWEYGHKFGTVLEIGEAEAEIEDVVDVQDALSSMPGKSNKKTLFVNDGKDHSYPIKLINDLFEFSPSFGPPPAITSGDGGPLCIFGNKGYETEYTPRPKRMSRSLRTRTISSRMMGWFRAIFKP